MNPAVDGYDFVVVGGGTAGCVLAARLSENPDARVLLLEAGSREPQPASAVPAAWPTLMGSPADWGDTTVVQAATGTRLPYERGRGLGGSSAINGMAFTRGHRASYDAWPTAGAKGWGWADLLPFLRRSERTEGKDPALRGVDGPLPVGPADPLHPVAVAALDAAAEAGHPRAVDISGGLEEGFGAVDLTIAEGRRVSAADAYLRPALERPNLDVVTDALVHRVLVEGGRCTGVEYGTGTATSTVRAGEVVLTAGTVGSAHLLLRSGIGPAGHLRAVGVDVLLDLPGVGENLQDHVASSLVHAAVRPVPRAVNGHGDAVGLVRTDPALAGPDVQVLVVDVPLSARAFAVPPQGYTLSVSLMTPRTRGTVRLTSAQPDAEPAVDPDFYRDPHDLDVMLAGLRIAREIGGAAAMAPWRGPEALPGPDVRSDDDLRAYLRASSRSYHHPVGTCCIGDDEHAVVDTDLRVRGVDGLRVADASVMPTIVAGNTQAAVFGIAERAAALIRGEQA